MSTDKQLSVDNNVRSFTQGQFKNNYFNHKEGVYGAYSSDCTDAG